MTYFGFTIGPIYDVIKASKKTREMWFGSYFFSWYMRMLFDKIASKIGKDNIIIPSFNSVLPKCTGGFFPDHLIGKTEIPLKEFYDFLKSADNLVKEDVDLVINNLLSEFTKDPNFGGFIPEVKTHTIIDSYLLSNFVCLEKEIIRNEPSKINNEVTIVSEIEDYLYTLERNRTFPAGQQDNTCYRCKALPSVINIKDKFDRQKKEYGLCPICFLKYNAHKIPTIIELTGLVGRPFPSVPEISASELTDEFSSWFSKLSKDEIDEKDFFKKGNFIPQSEKEKTKGNSLYKPDSRLKPYHKYMAFVQADGDDLGKLIKMTGNHKELSISLFNFSQEVYTLCIEYGAKPIYLGGDDILLFSPLFYNGKSVIDLVSELQKKYSQIVGAKATISFGVNIIYYKHPISTAMNELNYLLNGIAKKMPSKNSLALQLVQHSGQKTALNFSFADNENLQGFISLLDLILKGERENKHLFPHSLHHKLFKFIPLLNEVTTIEQINYFFKNEFNEPVHQTLTAEQEIEKHIIAHSSINGKTMKTEGALKRSFEDILSQIRFIKFLTGESND